MIVHSVRSAVYWDTILQFIDTKRIDSTARVGRSLNVTRVVEIDHACLPQKPPGLCRTAKWNIQTCRNILS